MAIARYIKALNRTFFVTQPLLDSNGDKEFLVLISIVIDAYQYYNQGKWSWKSNEKYCNHFIIRLPASLSRQC
ncbi:MAG: hypothetical protein OFPI_05220 [Osedax symbiont Rs2]|nr:MAG: hypothetical protein OFPI_05220 [Osedax symbiont Rs2]